MLVPEGLVALPAITLLTALLASPVLRGLSALVLASAASSVASLAMVYLSLGVLLEGGVATAALTLPAPPYSYRLAIDQLSAPFVLALGVVGLASSVYGVPYIQHYAGGSLTIYSFTYPLFLLSMYSLLAATDTIGFIVFWELMTIAAFFLISFDARREEARRAALKYLLLSHVGSGLIVTALITMALAAGTTSYGGLRGLELEVPTRYMLLGLLIVGFGIKAALVPMHSWLPDAHPEAPSNVSAILSGAMIKMAVYGVLRFGVSLHALELGALGISLASLGALSIAYGTSMALVQADSKKLMAYSSVAQMGYVFLGLGAGALGHGTPMGAAAAAAGVLHVLNHAVAKGLLFLVAGSILYATGTRDLSKLGGLSKRMPVTFASGLIGSLAISGIPPLNCFVSKWLIITSALLVGDPLVAVYACVALFGSALTTAAFAKFVVRAFMTGALEGVRASEVPAPMYLATASLAALCVLLGVYPYAPLALASAALVGFDLPVMLLAGLMGELALMMLAFATLLATTTVLAAATSYALVGRVRIRPLWVFGASGLAPRRLGLSAESYYTELQRVYRLSYVAREHAYRLVVRPLASGFLRAVEGYDGVDTRLYAAQLTIAIFLAVLALVSLYALPGGSYGAR